MEKMMNDIIISSPAFEPNGWIPDCHSGYGENISPELHIDGIVENAVSLIVTLDDMGHPIEPGYNHWIVWNIPPVCVIPANLPKGSICEQPIHIEQGLAYGKHCYRGPKPPFNWNHEYKFTVYSLDTVLTIGTDADKKSVLKAADEHILQIGVLMAKYQRKHK